MRIQLQSRIRLGQRGSRGLGSTFSRGYCFAEVLISTAILGFVGTSLYTAFAFGFYVVQSTRLDLRATQILVQKVEGIRLLNWTQLLDTNQYLLPTFVEAYDPAGLANSCAGTIYAGKISSRIPTAAEVPDAYRTNMRTITVSIYWTNYNGAKPIPQMRQMQTRVARSGMQNYIWGAQ